MEATTLQLAKDLAQVQQLLDTMHDVLGVIWDCCPSVLWFQPIDLNLN